MIFSFISTSTLFFSSFFCVCVSVVVFFVEFLIGSGNANSDRAHRLPINRFDATRKIDNWEQFHSTALHWKEPYNCNRPVALIKTCISIESYRYMQWRFTGWFLSTKIAEIQTMGGFFRRRMALLRYEIMPNTLVAAETLDDISTVARNQRR